MSIISKPIKFSGVGLQSGKPVNVVIKPSKRPGIWFKRVDLGCDLISAKWDNVRGGLTWDTTIGIQPNCVRTIEHLMAALFICGVDSAVIEIDDIETPIMDGSAKKFIELISKNVKFDARNTMKKIIVKKEVVAYRKELIKKMPLKNRIMLWLYNLKTGRKENGFVRLSPDSRGFVMNVTLDYPDKIIGIQRIELIFDGDAKSRQKFIKDFSKSRSFGRIWEWERLKKQGMGRGANEHNILAINEKGDGTLNKLHYPDEFVRHKLIDALGDFYLSGGMIVGQLESWKGSHGLNNLVLRKLFADPSNYEIV